MSVFQKVVYFASSFLCLGFFCGCSENQGISKQSQKKTCDDEIRFMYRTTVNALSQRSFDDVTADARHGLSKPAKGRNILGSLGFREANSINYFPLCAQLSSEPFAVYLRAYPLLHPNSAFEGEFEISPDLAKKLRHELTAIAMPLDSLPSVLKRCAIEGAPEDYLCAGGLPEANFLLAKLYASCTTGLYNKKLAEGHLQIAKSANVTLSDEFTVSICSKGYSK